MGINQGQHATHELQGSQLSARVLIFPSTSGNWKAVLFASLQNNCPSTCHTMIA